MLSRPLLAASFNSWSCGASTIATNASSTPPRAFSARS
jgi:hypothetical protein